MAAHLSFNDWFDSNICIPLAARTFANVGIKEPLEPSKERQQRIARLVERKYAARQGHIDDFLEKHRHDTAPMMFERQTAMESMARDHQTQSLNDAKLVYEFAHDVLYFSTGFIRKPLLYPCRSA